MEQLLVISEILQLALMEQIIEDKSFDKRDELLLGGEFQVNILILFSFSRCRCRCILNMSIYLNNNYKISYKWNVINFQTENEIGDLYCMSR